MLSLLGGIGGGNVIVKVGLAVVHTRVDEEGHLAPAVTGGCDVSHSIGRRTAIVVAARYVRVFRDAETRGTGIGSDIYRLGCGVQWTHGFTR